MSSKAPLSSTASSSLIWEIDGNATQVFGPSPIGYGATTPSIGFANKRLARVLEKLRENILPKVIDSANLFKIYVIRRSRVADQSDPLATRWLSISTPVYGMVAGPTIKDVEQGFMAMSDLKVLIAHKDLQTTLSENDVIEINTVRYDVVQSQGHPYVPTPIGYWYAIRRMA
ncbi:MAG: hypothetical protein AAF720_00875 [Pseudomonadota bacterium]